MDLKESLIENQSTILNANAAKWQEVVKVPANPLVELKAVTLLNYNKIIKSTEGILANYLFLPKNARPGKYVLKDSFSFVTLESLDEFQDNQEVDIQVCLASTSNENHNGNASSQITIQFSSEEISKKIYSVKDQHQLLELIE